MRLRNATPADFHAFYPGHETPAIWWGVVAEDDDGMAGMGSVTWRWREPRMLAWCSFDCRRPLSPVVMHRVAVRTLHRLRELGEPMAYCFCDDRVSGAERWLRRLGFARDEVMTETHGEMVWSVRLADG